MRTMPDNLSQVVLTSVTVTVDGHGYLTNPDDWNVEFAQIAAGNEGISLTPDHMALIDFMRAYLDDHGIMPDVRFVLKYISQHRNVDKIGAHSVLFDLFPYGYVKQACKIAGMKQPRAWSTG